MNKILKVTKRFFIPFVLVIFVCVIIFQLVAIQKLPFVSDEPNDFTTISRDFSNFFNFFENSNSVDQSRLPFLISMPFLYYLDYDDALIALRVLFLAFHLLYLFFCYKLIKLLTKDKFPPFLFALLLATSCYLASFAIFSISTGDTLYLLMHIICIYSFIKSYINLDQKNIFSNYLALSLFLALCISSKLFGVLLLIAFFVFHLLRNKNRAQFYIKSVNLNKLVWLGSIFLLGIIIVNIFPIHNFLKTILALICSLVYLLVISCSIYRERKNYFPKARVNFAKFWAVLIFTSFNLTLVFSPIYLNFANLFSVINWCSQWGWAAGDLTVNSHYYDIALIVLVKYGIVSFLALVLVLIFSLFLYRKRRVKSSQYFVLLFFLIFIIHFMVISVVKHKVTWYPLAIFFILYLPIVLLLDYSIKNRFKKLTLILTFCTVIVVGDNTYRYIYWFPYGHFDGAQFGEKFIGHNRPAIISFEVAPMLLGYLELLENKEAVRVNCQFSYVSQYNLWTTSMLKEKLDERNRQWLLYSTDPLIDNDFDYLLTSPVGYPDIEQRIQNIKCKKIKSFYIKDINVLNVWAKEI